MRTLFLSEKRCISNLMEEKWGVGMQSEPPVLKEYSAEPLRVGKRLSFNRDFSLDFVEDFTESRQREGTMNTALPNTFGTDLYLFVETPTLNPLHFELMFGEAFSIKYYAPYIKRVEAAVRDAVLSQQGIGILSREALLQRVPLKKSASARVLVVGGDVCFLYFPSEAVPVMRGSYFDLAESGDRHIACYLDGDEIVCFDGWIRTEVAASDRVLVAQPEEEP
jgi:hypothetical protein